MELVQYPCNARTHTHTHTHTHIKAHNFHYILVKIVCMHWCTIGNTHHLLILVISMLQPSRMKTIINSQWEKLFKIVSLVIVMVITDLDVPLGALHVECIWWPILISITALETIMLGTASYLWCVCVCTCLCLCVCEPALCNSFNLPIGIHTTVL